jgi:hypothetical protein
MPSPISTLIQGVAQSVLKSWLRQNELRHTAPNHTALVTLLQKLMDEGDLTLEQLKAGVREIEEYGGKRVYLRNCLNATGLTDRAAFSRRLTSAGITMGTTYTDSIRKPSRPQLNYAVWRENEIRIKYSETHTHVEFSKITRQSKDDQRTKFIVISVDPTSGFMRVFLDPAGDEHPHPTDQGGWTDDSYVDFYFQKVLAIFGDVENVDLIQPVQHLLGTTPRIFSLLKDQGWTPDNYRYTFAGREDVRDAAAYQAAAEAAHAPGPGASELIRGWWLEAASNGQLDRDLYSLIKPPQSTIQFKADCLAKEAEYAISTIRTI